jgi:FMN phosphatase YigB (HAD superfamily)
MVILDLDDTLCGNFQRFKLDQHIIDILNYLKSNNIILGIATLNPWADYLIQEYDVSNLFTYICCNDFNNSNDDKTVMLKYMMDNSGILAENILYFDDSDVQCEQAKKLNIRSVLVKPLLKWDDINYGFDLYNK